jgi:hypothetical protein
MDIKEDYKNEMLNLIEQHSEIQEQEAVEEKEEIVETENIEESPQEEETENKESENIEPEVDFDKELSGLPKELIETVKTFKDPEDRAKAIKIAKEQRAREDRLHLQLGNSKKELENISGLLKSIQSNPAETFKALAKQVNFDLRNAVDEAVMEDELYLTPEEQIRRESKHIQQNSYKQLQEEVNKREARELLADFLEDTSRDEELITNYQSEFVNFYNQELQKEGVKDYYPLKNRKKALEIAYKKLEILQPDYEDKMRAKILKEMNEQKKEKFDEAKRQQKISKPVANANKPTTYEETQKALISKYYV